MRQIGTIADVAAAQALADYLLTQKIETKLSAEPGGWEIWVCDEDRVGRAREELAAFTANPHEPRFTNAGRAAAGIRRAEDRAEQAARKRQIDIGQRLAPKVRVVQPVTAALIAICIVTALLTRMGEDDRAVPGDNRMALSQWLYINHFDRGDGFISFRPGLPEVQKGQGWRLVTPVFLHFSFLHLLGNMLWLYYLGNQIEFRRGPVRYVALFLVIAVFSNLAEYYLGDLSFSNGRLTSQEHPNFGGMSGVVFGLFGYTWMKMRFEPELGLWMSQQTFLFSMLWFFFCLTGFAGHIANGAHVSGLLIGVAIGAAPPLFRRLGR
jgi:GlpG protein